MTQDLALRLGDIDLTSGEPTDEGWLIETMVDGTSLGNPKALREFVKSLFVDGSLSVLQGTDNREPEFSLRVSAPEAIAGPALAAAEKALQLATRVKPRPAPLVYVPPATDSATTVFDVEAADLARDTGEGWDREEVMREYRYYTLSLSCWPWVRPETTVVVPAIPVPPDPGGAATIVVIDTCDSKVGWTDGEGGTSDVGQGPGWLYSTGSGASNDYAYELRRTGTVAMGATPYIRVTAITAYSGTPTTPRAIFTGAGGAMTAELFPIASEPSAFGGLWVDYYFQPGFATVEKLAVKVPWGPPWSENVGLSITHVARTDTIGDKANSTLRQQRRTANIIGSAPTQAEIRLYDATPGPLGADILVYTSQNPLWQPPLRKWLAASSAVTADATMVSGGRNTMATTMKFLIPANLLTEGTYSLLAKMNVTTAGTLNWATRIVSSTGAATVGSSITQSGSIALGVTGGQKVLNLAAMLLPPVAAEGDQMVELTLTGTANMTFDEGWLCSQTDGVLTWIPDTDSLTWIEIRSPEIGSDRPTIYGGTGALGTNPVCIDWKAAAVPGFGACGQHITEPGLMQVFTICTTSLVSQSVLEFYPRYHSHVLTEAA